jgi:phosphopantothenoylcysteine decarboxylase/phosphopantothenate--cysteine ligase
MKKKTVVLGITGSIASYKACDIISLLRKAGFDCVCVLTREAKEFITPLTLETLSGNKVIDDLFRLPERREPVHTSLADRASLVLIAPATANVIGKIAYGICDDMLTCVVMATKAPVLIAPAMHENMYKNRIVQENIAKLKKNNYKFIGPVKGHLACGREGMGHIADVKTIFQEVKRLLR